MWLNAYGAKKHRVYLGKSPQALKYQETLNDECNVFYLEESLEPGETYYWRVDTELSPTFIYEGDTWKFEVKDSSYTYKRILINILV